MATKGSALGLAAVVLALLAGCAGPGRGEYQTSYHYTTTQDGFMLALERYEPKVLDADKNPVILCHGLSYNLQFWDLGEKVSLPRYLAEQGYDVWSLSLRGATPSSQPFNSAMRRLARFSFDPETLRQFQNRVRNVTMTDWSVDDHIRQDVPAALAYVREKTGHRRVHWIGHSMGGMVMFGYLGQAGGAETDQVKTFVAVAVPMAVFHPLSDPYQFLVDKEKTLTVGSRVMGSSAPATIGVIAGDVGLPMDRLFYHGANVDDGVLRGLFYKAEEEISPGQMKQLVAMVRTERFQSMDGQVDYTAGLRAVTRPTYVLAGTVDNMATEAAVKYVYREIASQPKQFRLFGRVNGHKNDYGHDDLVIGKHARQEVYPTILEWLEDFPVSTTEQPLPLQPGAMGQGQ